MRKNAQQEQQPTRRAVGVALHALDSTRDTGDTHVTRPTQTNSVVIINLPSARALRGRMKRLLKAEREQFSVVSVQSVDDDCGCSNGERAIVLSERVDLFVAS